MNYFQIENSPETRKKESDKITAKIESSTTDVT